MEEQQDEESGPGTLRKEMHKVIGRFILLSLVPWFFELSELGNLR